jgi:aconitate hydratase
VLSGNRNFEARIHPNLKANFLATPPLVVAYAIAGNVTRDLMTEPVGQGKNGRDVYLGDIWPSSDEIYALMKFAMNPRPSAPTTPGAKKPGKLWDAIKGVKGQVYNWPKSTYIAQPPFFDGFTMVSRQHGVGRQGRASWRCSATRSPPTTSRPAGSIKETVARRQVPDRQRRAQGRLQFLRLAPRQPRRDDARHLRQRAHQEPDDPARPDGSREEGGSPC